MSRMNAKPASDSTAASEAREIVGLFRSLRRHLVRGSRAELARSGLTAAQVSVISLLGTQGPMTLGDLSRELELSHSTVSGIVDRLQAKEIVERKPSVDDRRYVQISLTESVASQAPALGDEGPIGAPRGGAQSSNRRRAAPHQRRSGPACSLCRYGGLISPG